MTTLFRRRQAVRRLASRPTIQRRVVSVDRDTIGAAVNELVDRLLYHGVELVAREDGQTIMWFPEPGAGRRPEQPHPLVRGMTDGAMRELRHLVRTIPGVSAALHKRLRTGTPPTGVTVL